MRLVSYALIVFIITSLIPPSEEGIYISRRKLKLLKKLALIFIFGRNKKIYTVPFPLPLPLPVITKTQPIIYRQKVPYPVEVPVPVPVMEPVPYPVEVPADGSYDYNFDIDSDDPYFEDSSVNPPRVHKNSYGSPLQGNRPDRTHRTSLRDSRF